MLASQNKNITKIKSTKKTTQGICHLTTGLMAFDAVLDNSHLL